MTTNELKDYLGIIVDMEKERYLQEQLKSQLQYRISRLGYAQNYYEPQKEKVYSGEWGSLLIGGFIMGVLPGAIIGFLLDSFLNGALIGGIIVAVGMAVSEGIRISNKEDEVQKKYEQDFRNYQQAIDADRLRVQEEQKIKLFLTQEYTQLDNRSKQSEAILQKLYNTNIIFGKYRGFAKVASLYEYFCAGRCTTLEGHEGAYNILEMELRLDRISVQLDTVISHLEEIKQNQYIIYSAICEANRKLGDILESNNRIETGVRGLQVQGDELNERISGLQVTSGLNLYFNELTQKELSYMNRMKLG